MVFEGRLKHGFVVSSHDHGPHWPFLSVLEEFNFLVLGQRIRIHITRSGQSVTAIEAQPKLDVLEWAFVKELPLVQEGNSVNQSLELSHHV